MVTRYYICDNCDHHMVIQQKMNDPLKKKCPECGKLKLYQDLTGQHTFVYQDCKTLGHQAQRNTERMGKYDLESKRKKDSEAKKFKKKRSTWYNKEGADLKQGLKHLNTPEKKHRYIMEGK
jgi:putative FmdB family regulatory protein